jgi:hypothetical protein
MPGQVNPDGTVQVSPPLASAFGPASASAPTPLPQGAPGVPPTGGTDPGFASAIVTLLQHLASNFAPKAITQVRARTNEAVDKASE